jgi:trigger factor
VQVTVERTGPCVAKVSFSVPAADFDGEVARLLRQASSQVRMKGFRPGHVPAALIEKQHGKEIRQEARQRFLNQAYEQAVRDEKLRPLAHPRVDLGEPSMLAGLPFTATFELSLRPEFPLGEYKGIAVETKTEEVTDEKVEQAIENVRQQQAYPEPAGDAGLPEDGVAMCKVELFFEGKSVFVREGLRLGPGTQMPGMDQDAFKAKMIGAKDKDAFEIDLTFPEDFEHEAARGKPGRCSVTVDQAFRVVLPDRETVMRTLGQPDEAAFRAFVRERLVEAHQEQEDRRVENAILDQLIDAHAFELPESMVEDQIRARKEQLRRELAERGADEAAIAEQITGQEAAAREAAIRASRGYFLIEAIAHKESIQVTEEELVAELKVIAQRNRTSLEEVSKHYKEQNLFGQLAMELVERRVRRLLRESAKLSGR